jgi:hypothetical protein
MAKKKSTKAQPPIRDGMRAFYDAYAFLNTEVFGSELPMDCRIITNRKPNMFSYFKPDCYGPRGDAFDGMRHELGLNPDHFPVNDDRTILAELAHRMVMRWQHLHGTLGSKGRHNKDFAARAISIGLQPTHDASATGETTGGERLQLYVVDGGPFELAYQKLAMSGFQFDWEAITRPTEAKPKKNRAKFVCVQGCGNSNRAKPGSPGSFCKPCAIEAAGTNEQLVAWLMQFDMARQGGDEAEADPDADEMQQAA